MIGRRHASASILRGKPRRVWTSEPAGSAWWCPINYACRVVYIRFVGTHAGYDRINAETGVMQLKPVRTEADYEAALAEIERLTGGRRLTIEMIWRLHRELGLPAEAVIRPYQLAGRSGAAARR